MFSIRPVDDNTARISNPLIYGQAEMAHDDRDIWGRAKAREVGRFIDER